MFTPRWRLPGARASRQCLLPVAASPAQALTDSVSPNSDTGFHSGRTEAPVGSLVGSLLESSSSLSNAPRKASAAPKPVLAATGEKPPRQDQASFSLAFWRVHPLVMVVDSRQAKALPTEALLQSIMAALGINRQPLPRAEIQHWPVAGVGDKSWDAGREMIQAFLESRLQDQPVRYLVLMGAEAARVIAADAVQPGGDSSPDAIKLEAFDCELLLTPSLADLLLAPRTKAGLWALLKPLRELSIAGASH